MKEGRIRPSLLPTGQVDHPNPDCRNEGGSNSTLVGPHTPLPPAYARRRNEGGSNSTLVVRKAVSAIRGRLGRNEGGSNSTLVGRGDALRRRRRAGRNEGGSNSTLVVSAACSIYPSRPLPQ